MPRIVSLIASATEIVCALGFEDQLVGRSHECDFPESVQRLPVCTEPKFDVEGSSCEIDQRVKAMLQDRLVGLPRRCGAAAALEPDVIVTQSHCEVCAVSLRDVEQAVCSWLSARPKLVSLAPNAWPTCGRTSAGRRSARRPRARRRTDSELAESHGRDCGPGAVAGRRGRRWLASSGSTR